MKYKLLVLDIDGTLVGKQMIVSSENKNALEYAVSNGMTVTLCTGRAPRGARSVLSQLSLDGYHTFFDGALVINPETAQEAYIQAIEVDVLNQAVKWAHSRGMDIELYSSTNYFAEHENWSTNAHRHFFEIEPVFCNYEDLIGRELIIKIGSVVTNDGDNLLLNEFQKDFTGRLNFTRVKTPAYPDIDFINIVSPLVSKGEAIAHLAAMMDIRKEEIMAIGDGSNDISLLSMAGLSIAMPHSPEELRAVADFITTGVEENGVAAAVHKFILPN